MYYRKFNSNRFVPALIILAFTFPIIILYGTLYDKYSEQVFIKIVNDKLGYKSKRIWSKNFEITGLELQDDILIVNYLPIYVYDWNKEDSFGYEYSINNVYVDLLTTDKKIKTFKLPSFEKGSCKQINISQLE